MKKLIVGSSLASVLALALLVLGSAAVSADVGMPTPGDGSAFGQHIASMAPGNGGMMPGTMGECVSTMASQGTCTCPVAIQ